MRTPARRPASGRAGFTLIELVVAILLTSALISLLVSTIFTVNKSWDTSQATVDRTQSTRAAMEFMVKDLRMAGSGFSGRPIAAGGIPGNRLYPVHPTPGVGSDADTLYLTGSFDGVRTTLTGPMVSPGDDIAVALSDSFDIGDLVIVTNGIRADLFEITSDPGQSGFLLHSGVVLTNDVTAHNGSNWPAGGYPVGALAVRVDRIAYWIEDVNGEKRLLRRLNDESPSAVANNIDDLIVTYGLLDGTVVADPVDPSFITSVTLTTIAMTSTGEPDTVAVDVRPRVFS